MATLTQNSGSFDISSELELLTYTNAALTSTAVVALAVIGSDSKPVMGNGTYYVRCYQNSILILPDAAISVPDVDKFATQSRSVVVMPGETVSFNVIGDVADTDVEIEFRLVEEPIFEAIDNLEITVDTDPIITAVIAAMNNACVRPQTVKLGVCRSQATQMPLSIASTVKQMPTVIRCQ